MNIWSSVGVMYRMSVIRKKGTWRTECSRKCRPSTTASSQWAWFMSMRKEKIHSRPLIPTIYKLFSQTPSNVTPRLQGSKLNPTGMETTIRMAIPAATANAAWR